MISYVAMNRIVEERAASDPKYRKGLTRPLRADARRLDDARLVEKLRSYGIDLDRTLLKALCQAALSAEAVARDLIPRSTFKDRSNDVESDWVWIAVDALWRRWFHDIPSFERLDDQIQSGYAVLAAAGSAPACRIWLDAWAHVVALRDRTGATSIREFDDRFRGSQSLFNWIQDLESETWNAGLEDREFHVARTVMAEELLESFVLEETYEHRIGENWRRALAQSHYELGQTGKADALFREWLTADPRWGWGWIGWADCHYRFTRTGLKDPARAEAILREGLAVDGVRNRPDLLDRLADLLNEFERGSEAEAFRTEAGRLRDSSRKSGAMTREALTRLEAGDTSILVGARTRVGRNDPCPCGSGKKFKKCCGR